MQNEFWGMDFGTTTTFLTSEEVPGSIIPLGRQSSPYLPSVAAFDGEKMLIGEDAFALPEEQILRSVKRNITKSTNELELITSGKPHKTTADEIISLILQRAISVASRSEEIRPIRLGCPAMWNADQRLRLISIAEKAGIAVNDSTLIDEPIAACINWVSQNQKEDILGKVIVFDMGGGTLDIAMMHVEARKNFAPSISVLASMGIDEAGDDLDEGIAKALVEELGTQPKFVNVNLYNHIGWIRRAARALKEDLGEKQVASSTLVIPGFENSTITLNRDDIKSIFARQIAKAMDLLRGAVINGLLRSSNLSKTELERMKDDELFRNVDYFVMAGGMARMSVLREMISDNIAVDKIRELKTPDEAIAKGLGSSQIYESLNLHLPSFTFQLEWEDEDSGHLLTRELYRAYTPLAPQNSLLETSDWIVRLQGLPKYGAGKIRAISLQGEYLQLKNTAQVNDLQDGMTFQFGHNKEARFILRKNGEILFQDGAQFWGKFKVKRWPVISKSKKTGSDRSSNQNDISGDFKYGISPSD